MSKERFEVKIIRIKHTGEELIGFVYETRSTIEIKYPKVFYTTLIDTESDFDEEYTLIDWMPTYAYGMRSIELNIEDVLFTTYPTVKFGIGYLKLLQNEILDEKFKEELKQMISVATQNEPEEDVTYVVPASKKLH